MESKIKGWIDLYAKIAESIGELVIILDSSFEILHANQKAISLFYIDDLSISLEQVFTNETVHTLTDSIGPVIFTNKKKSIKNFLLNLKTGDSYEYDLIINPVEIDEEKLILLVFNKQNFNNETISVDRIQTRIGKYLLYNQNEFLKSLIEELEQLIPFTLVGIKRIQAIIDRYNFQVWIKDSQSRFLAINKCYSEVLGIDPTLAPGKKQEAFLPKHLSSIYKSLDEYILSTHNPVILEGIGKKVNLSEVNQRTFQVPILDKRNNLYAVVGLINDEKIDKNKENLFPELITGFIDRFPKAIVLLNFDGKLEQANQEFCKFLGKDWENIISKNFIDLFPYLLSQNIKSFIESDLINDEIFLGSDLNPVDYSTSVSIVNLIKISSKNLSSKYFIIIIDDSSQVKKEEYELQNFIKNRGKMFDILIQNNPEPIFIYDKENLKFLEVNEAAIKFYGFNRDEFLQMDLTDLYAPEDIQTLLNSFGDDSSEGKFSKPFRHRKKDGSTVIVEISKNSFRFNEREAHFNIVKDITSIIEKDKQNQMLQVIFNSTDSLVFKTDASGFITFINYPVNEKLGYTSDDLIKLSFASLVPDEDRALVNTTIFQSQVRDEISLATKIKMQDGEFIETELTASPILDFNNEVESFTIIVKPAKYLFHGETPKEVVKEVIKEVIVERTPETDVVNKTPDANFISGLFHEILTPLNVIIGFTQDLISGINNPTEEQLETSEIINQNRIKMMDTMNAVVEYSDIVQNKSEIKIEDIAITDIVDLLDKNIKDITGLNDIQFGYGKISSSLKFRSDKQKFENLVFYLIKLISRLSIDKKVYFSAYSIDSDTFCIALSDQYGSSSEYVADTFNSVFNEGKDPKDYGLPKLTTYLAKVILSLLGGNYHKSIVGALKQEAGFLFPQALISKGEKLYGESVSTLTSEVLDEEKREEISTPVPEVEIKAKEKLEEPKDLEESFAEESNEKIQTLRNDEDEVFRSVKPISDELLSKIEKEQTQQETESELSEPDNQEILNENIVPSAEDESLEENISDTQEEGSETSFVSPVPQLNLGNLNCLYIEDQVDSQILFKVQMKGLKNIKFAVSFEESQPLLRNNQFDFIVMDINLQGEYNGLDALKIIRTMPALTTVPIIAVTAYVLPGDKEKFIAAGFDDFISKPIFNEKMIESLEKIFLYKSR